MSTYISLDNLARYDMKAKARSKDAYADASAACWQKTEKTGAVTCVPAPESPLEPVVEFKFKETLPDGEKGPGNPSSIAGVSSVKVTRCNANMLPIIGPGIAYSGTLELVSYTKNGDGTYTFSGTATIVKNTSGSSVASWKLLNLGFPKGRYKVGFLENTATIKLTVSVLTNGVNNYPQATGGSSITIEIGDGTTYVNIYFQSTAGVTYNETVTPYICLEEVDADSMNEGTDYTISLGNTYYGGTLDVASGRLTVTHRMVEPSSGTVDISDHPALLPLEYTDTYGRTVTSDGNTLSVGSSGGQIVYRLANPYAVQIDPTPIDSLPALDKTSPRINTIYTDAENVQVGYAEHPAYTEQQINNAILALGGNV